MVNIYWNKLFHLFHNPLKKEVTAKIVFFNHSTRVRTNKVCFT